jgi:hypothetical protein
MEVLYIMIMSSLVKSYPSIFPKSHKVVPFKLLAYSHCLKASSEKGRPPCRLSCLSSKGDHSKRGKETSYDLPRCNT